jgi:hypothetical protein
MNFKLKCVLPMPLLLTVALASADSLELKNGSLIKGKFMGGSESEISFQVGSSVQKYNVADVVSLKFDSDSPTGTMPPAPKALAPRGPDDSEHSPRKAGAPVTVAAGTQISVRTSDTIDSAKSQVGDRFQASLEEPLTVDGNVVVAKGADVYGRLTEAKQSGTFTGKSNLRLELTGIVVDGRTVPLTTGDYEVAGKSRTASTAKRSVGGAAVGSIIGALAGGGKGAAIGAGVGAGAGAGSEVITKGDQVKVPSETVLDFTLQQDMLLPAPKN